MVQDARFPKLSTMDAAAQKINSLSSITKLGDKWKKHEPNSKSLETVIGKTAFAVLCDAYKMRCARFHGESHPSTRKIRKKARQLRTVIEESHKKCGNAYGFSGWKHKR